MDKVQSEVVRPTGADYGAQLLRELLDPLVGEERKAEVRKIRERMRLGK